MKVIPNSYISDFTYIKRTWKERLFTLPWCPFKSNKTVSRGMAYILMDGSILVSPSTYAKLGPEGILKLEKQCENEGVYIFVNILANCTL
jgi:hypothetical protein